MLLAGRFDYQRHHLEMSVVDAGVRVQLIIYDWVKDVGLLQELGQRIATA